MSLHLLCKSVAPLALLFACSQSVRADMVEMDADQMSAVHAQALFWSDTIPPNSLTGSGGAGSSTDFSFYRVGLDVDLAFNLNIDKLQLGCGGTNENVVANACDLDMDYVRFMGRSGSTPGAAVTSDFSTRRPYLEIAVREDASKTNREVVGIKIGFENADGALGIGRTYANNQTNVERGGTCNSGANSGAGALACESGINYMSGYLRAELSGDAQASHVLGHSDVCFGNTRTFRWSGGGHGTNDTCGPGDAYFTTVSGTRMHNIQDANIPAKIYHGSFSGDTAAFDLRESLRFIHSIVLDAALTKDFFISFQRQQIAYPKYDKSGYAVTANTGWWMNVPHAELLEIRADVDYGLLGSLSLLATMQEGINITDLDINQEPPVNCFNSMKFC